MFKFYETVLDTLTGAAVQDAEVWIFPAAGGGGASTIYSDAAGLSEINQPMLTDSNGLVQCYVPDGLYNVEFRGGGWTTTIADYPMFDLSDMRADLDAVVTDLATNYYTKPQVDALIAGATLADGDYGDISVASGGTAWTVDNGAISLAKMANLADQTLIGNNSGGAAAPLALTTAQVTAMLNVVGTLKGLMSAADKAKLDTIGGVLATTALTDPNADRIPFWDDSAGAVAWLSLGANLSITGTTIAAAAAGLYDANWFNVKTYGAVGDGVTDDTVAIQAAIDACEAAGGGTVYFPRGVYIVNGALQDTARSNAQLLLPRRDYGDTEAITVVLRGEIPPPSVYSVLGATPLPDNLATIKGTLNVSGGTAPCMIGSHGPVGTFANFTNLYLVIRDLAVQMPANPVLTAIDASCVAQLDADNLLVHAGNFDIGTIAAQTTTTSYGLKTPDLNNGAMTRLGVVNIVGYHNCYSINEHCVGTDVTAAGSKQGFVFGAAFHGSSFTRLQAVWCQKGIVFTGGEHDTIIQQFNIEHAAAGTWVPTADVDDPSNYGRGGLNWHVVLAGAGQDAGFISNGAKYLRRERVQRLGSVLTLVDGATVTIDCNQSNSLRWFIAGAARALAAPTNPYDGQVFNLRITQDGTGGRTWVPNAKFKFPGGTPALSTAANARDFVSCQYDATDDTWNCSIMKGMA